MNILQKLTFPKKRGHKAIANSDNIFLSDNELVVQKLQDRINYLQSWLDNVLVRGEEQREEDVLIELSNMRVVSPSMLPYYVLDTYGHSYFSNEVDTEFKIKLASEILNYVKSVFPTYKNELLEGIANNNSKYTANYIYVEKV